MTSGSSDILLCIATGMIEYGFMTERKPKYGTVSVGMYIGVRIH